MVASSNGRFGLILRCALTAAAVLLAFALLRVGIADAWFRSAKIYFGAGPLSPARIELALARLEPAVRMDAQNPAILESLGDIEYRRASLAAEDLDARLGYLEKARDHYAAAVASRPNLGERWADLIHVYSDLIDVRRMRAAIRQEAGRHAAHDTHGLKLAMVLTADSPAVPHNIENDLQGLRQALERATRLAPWRSAVLHAVEKAASAHEELFGPEERRIVAAARERAADKKSLPR